MSKLRQFINTEWQGLAIIAAAWLAFFSRILFFGYAYFLDDLKIFYYPLEYSYSQFQHLGQLPLWSNYFGFGQPLMGWGQLGFFVPLHFVLRALSVNPLTLLQISVATYFALGLLGMYAFLRYRTFSVPASSLGALLFAFSGFAIGHLNHTNFYTSTMLLPWLLLATAVFVFRPTIFRTALLALIAATIAVSGQPQIIVY